MRKLHLHTIMWAVPFTCLLTGSSLFAQTLSYSPKLITFPNQAIGSTSPSHQITLNNYYAATVNINSIQVPAPFTETNNCGSSLTDGQSCTINVFFSPTAVKYYSTTLTISDNVSGSPQSVTLTGNGIIAVTYRPPVGGYYFNDQIVSTPSTAQAVTITNNQTTSLTFSSITSTSDYPFTTNCGNGSGGGTLGPGATCTIEVVFDPTVIGKRTANLQIAENAPGSPIVVPLTGTGISGTPGPGVDVTPALPCTSPSGTMQFAASVTDLSNTAVTWYVDGAKNGNTTVGTITASGLYTSPPYAGTHIIKAVSQASTSVSGSAKLTVSQSPNIEIYPYVASIPVGGQQTFQGQVCQVPQTTGVSFTVDDIAGGNATVGTVSNTGVYTAPPVAGKHTVRVTSSALNKTSGGVVTVFSAITADFGSRTFTTYPIPANMFGTGRGESIPTTSGRELLTEAGLTETRINANIPVVYATQTPNWTEIDPLISTIQAAGQHAILQLTYSPPWLQPTTGTCKANEYAAPTNVTEWATIAAAYVAHMDSTFPGVVQDYEIWNEPNATGMCSSNNLDSYMALYAAAAPAIKAQASHDGATDRVGGPVLAGDSATWLSTFLGSSTTAPYVDFVSYHQYINGLTELSTQWDTYNGDPSLYELTQDPTIGAFAEYNDVLADVAAGKQPGGAETPVYITEYNTNWAFFNDCCRNSATYAPVWNALYVTDLLDSVYKGSAKMPNKLIYFAGSAYPWFCMIGVLDTNLDCLYSAGATPAPYPQYYTYQLFASSTYLGLQGGGYMAKSLSTPTGGGGLATTAFYTSTQDAVVIVNPTSTAYPHISVTLANPGFASTQGTLYSVVNGAEIQSSGISFSVQGTSFTTTIDVPAYSVQGVSLK